MADTLTITLLPETAQQLRRLAAERGEAVEVLAQRLLAEVTADLGDSGLSDEQLADLRLRLAQPGRILSKEESDTFFDQLLTAQLRKD